MALILAWGVQAADLPKSTHDWPGYTGPDGTFADQSKVPILDDLSRAKLVWVSEHDDLGYGKTTSGGGHSYGKDYWRPSGSASLIVANGLVIAGYFNAKNSVMADDIILALDAATGKTRWKQVYTDKGINRGAGKHLPYGPTPVASQGKVFHLGSSGRLYCVDLDTGRPVWESDVGEEHKALEALKSKVKVTDDTKEGFHAREMKGMVAAMKTMVTPLMVIDGVLMVTVGDLHGFDTATGKKLWEIPKATAVLSVPCPAKLHGAMYALCSGSDGYMRLIRPKTGEVVWKEFLGAWFLPIVADGRAFVPRLQDPSKPKSKEQRPTLTAFALSETGAKMLWQSDFPMDGDSWNAYRDGVIYATAHVYQPAGGKVMAFKAEDGTLLGMYDDKEGDRGRVHLWGNRLVVVGDNHHESLASSCYYWALTPSLKDLAKSGKPHYPRKWGDYRGVCGYEVLIRDPFADGYQFTRAIDIKKGKGVIMCWDLRKQ
ncbi:MAG: PQQ-binding-like beta-propeller repeat protein [Tepidisphaeraceae bacterium]